MTINIKRWLLAALATVALGTAIPAKADPSEP